MMRSTAAIAPTGRQQNVRISAKPGLTSALRGRLEKARADGKSLRDRVPRTSHGEWTPSARRSDPVDLVLESSKGRIPELIPIRYGRMMGWPFTFYRATADIMAEDLAPTARTRFTRHVCRHCQLLY